MTSQRTRDRLIARLQDQGICNYAVLEAIRSVPRHWFVDEALAHRAYEDTALPIGHGQTISQPYIVARMTELLIEGAPLDKVLEIGTGSGYQTAVLARFAKEIVSLERIKVLQEKARQRLRALKINNVMLRYADGSVGLQDKAPFDGILAAAAPADVPQELLEQLAIGGRLVIPIGEHEQKLFRITRTEQGYEREFIEDVRFVPFRSGLR
ncbi:MAG: protein-L-isoaspartate O-methyltransferase [Pseudomonadales bacterium]|nr:protein-L-isoaspartate O-methyltransferase [Pseudomonadales bacterium]MEC8814145.1 protein-L-isoaspartate(D-aspartate) O-methyltransferase [Pseudomonadota bacterium]HAG94158.1 protein-L-isoaspartate(D-aspartate) O-methyltransferase [Gammaproteobacteria bacterium]MBI26887.1 protein-L-isoaspartate O-methyltransferase [Pseudomonadales bacterium]HAU12732.1 protein-L-isoaspartate(D-aspartate) O-methyltransferase [Gammaproteobacteria bacterium]